MKGLDNLKMHTQESHKEDLAHEMNWTGIKSSRDLTLLNDELDVWFEKIEKKFLDDKEKLLTALSNDIAHELDRRTESMVKAEVIYELARPMNQLLTKFREKNSNGWHRRFLKILKEDQKEGMLNLLRHSMRHSSILESWAHEAKAEFYKPEAFGRESISYFIQIFEEIVKIENALERK